MTSLLCWQDAWNQRLPFQNHVSFVLMHFPNPEIRNQMKDRGNVKCRKNIILFTPEPDCRLQKADQLIWSFAFTSSPLPILYVPVDFTGHWPWQHVWCKRCFSATNTCTYWRWCLLTNRYQEMSYVDTDLLPAACTGDSQLVFLGMGNGPSKAFMLAVCKEIGYLNLVIEGIYSWFWLIILIIWKEKSVQSEWHVWASIENVGACLFISLSHYVMRVHCLINTQLSGKQIILNHIIVCQEGNTRARARFRF